MESAIVASIAQMKITTNESIMDSKWETLPTDLLLKIQQRLDIRDQTRIYCVCKSWQSALSKAYFFPPVPLLFIPPQLEQGPFRFYDMVNSKSYDLKPTQGGVFRFQGSSYGWLVVVIDYGPRICLINPLTGVRKQLPDVTWETSPMTHKYILSSNPSLSDDFVVAVTASSLAYTRHGDCTWTNIQSKKFIIDIAFYEGELYGLTDNLEMMHIKIGSSGSQVTQISPLEDGVPRNYFFFTHLVESCIGLLRVERINKSTQDHYALSENTTGIRVYKFDFELGQWSDRLTDIGENVLFVGKICSVSMSSRDIPRGDSNTVYFVDNSQVVTFNFLYSRGWLRVGVFNLKTSIFKYSTATIEFVWPYSWPLPIWVTPPLISG